MIHPSRVRCDQAVTEGTAIGACLLLALQLVGCGPTAGRPSGQAEPQIETEPWESYSQVTEIEVTSDPPGAQINLSGEAKGVTPLRTSFKRGGMWGVPNYIVIKATRSDTTYCTKTRQIGRDEPTPTTVFFDMTRCEAEERTSTLLEVELDVKPEFVSVPSLEYPDSLRREGIPGRVLIEAVIGTDGRVEPETIEVLYCTDEAFAMAVKKMVVAAEFRPGRIGQQAVRTLIRQPIEFKLESSITVCETGLPPCPPVGVYYFPRGRIPNEC